MQASGQNRTTNCADEAAIYFVSLTEAHFLHNDSLNKRNYSELFSADSYFEKILIFSLTNGFFQINFLQILNLQRNTASLHSGSKRWLIRVVL